MEALCANLVLAIMTGVYWGDEKYAQLWKRCVEALARREFGAGSTSYTAWASLRYYPATLVLYAVGIAAISRGRYSLLKLLLEDSTGKDFHQPDFIDERPLWRILNARNCFPSEPGVFLPEGRRPTAGSDRIARQLRWIVSEVLGEDDEFDNLFDELELTIALVYADRDEGRVVAMGRFARYPDPSPNNQTPLSRMKMAINEQKTNHPLLVAGMFGGELGKLQAALNRVWSFALQAIGPW